MINVDPASLSTNVQFVANLGMGLTTVGRGWSTRTNKPIRRRMKKLSRLSEKKIVSLGLG